MTRSAVPSQSKPQSIARGRRRRSARKQAAPAPLPRDDGTAPHLPALAALGLEGLVDTHVHWFPENVQQKVWAYFDHTFWGICYRGSPPERLEWLRRNGVRAFTTLNYAHRPGMAAWLNEWTAEFAADVPEAIPCGTFYPEPGVGAYVRRSIEEYRFRGFKLHLRVGDFDPSDPLLGPAFEQVEAARLPVVIHSGSAPGGGRFTAPGPIRALLKRHPALPVVIAHMGAGEFAEYLEMAESWENVFLDTTMVFVDPVALGEFPLPLLSRLEGVSHRILFGSDFPIIPYPISHAVESVLALPLSGAAKRRILWENGRALFGLEAAGARRC